MTSSRPPVGLTLSAAWAVYFVFLIFAYPVTPFAVMAMVVPLVLTGWYAPRWSISASVGLVHGAALAWLGWRIGAFDAWGADALPLVLALVTLLSWALALAGWTMRIVNLLRWRTDDLEAARREIEANAATVDAVYSASAAALVGVARDGAIISWNPGAEAAFGHNAHDAVGASIDMLAAVGHADDCTGRIRYVLDTGREMSTFSGKMRHADGQVLDVEVRPRHLVHPDGSQGVLLTVVDRTRETVLGDEISRQAQQQDRIIHNLDEVLYSIAVPSMNTLMMSRSVEQLTGKDAEDWANFRDFLELAHPDDREEVLRRWEHARSGEKSVLRWRLRTALGQHTWVEDRVVPARDDDGRVVRVDGSIRRIFREVELERQAQRMMRWLDALEPMTGGGAWSVDLRSGSWQWSGGMRRILAMEDEPEDGIEAWTARLDPESARAFTQLLAHPDNPHPHVLHIMDDAGAMQAFLVEPWVQRGADGEPIWLYGIVRPRQAKRRTRKARPELPAQAKKTAPPADEAQAAPLHAALVPPESAPSVQPLAVPPSSPLVGQHIGQALARARMTVAGALAAEEADVIAAMDDATGVAMEAATEWAQTPRIPTATKGLAVDDIHAEAHRLADGAERRAIHAVLAAEQKAAEAMAARAAHSAQRIQEQALQRIEAARAEARKEIEAAREVAAAEGAKARQAEKARIDANTEMARVVAAAQEAKEAALQEAEAGRVEALRLAAAARHEAEGQAKKAAQAEAARAEAEQAHQEALQAAEEAKAKARHEADAVRAEAMEQAEQAKKLAQQEAAKARQAQEAMQAAEEARRQALAAAEEAKAAALHEAGKTRSSALKTAKEAQERADAEAEKARRAEAARAQAEAASQRAAEAAEAAKAAALQDAEQARSEALQAAKEAQERAAREAAEARRAEAARKAAEEARATALKQVEEANQRARHEEKARKEAIQQAEKATAKAMAEAEKAMAAARVEAQRAQEAEQARKEAEAKVKAALREAEDAAAQARGEAETIKAEALEEAERAKAAARAEAAKAEQAEKALAEAIKEAHRARDQAIHEAQKARDEAIRAAEKARDEALREAAQARDEAMQQLAEAQLRVEQAETEAQEAWAEARAQAVEVVTQEAAEEVAKEAAGKVAAGEPAPDQESWTAKDMDVVWDDEIGWVPKPKGGQGNDKAEQLKAKSWQGGSAPKKGSGPWALD